MARRSARLYRPRRRRSYCRFQGIQGLREFLQMKCIITHRRTDVVRRQDLFSAYHRFCAEARHPAAAIVNVGRYLGSLQVWASKRLGGSNGRRQEYAYVGLCLHELPPRASQKGVSFPSTLSLVNAAPLSPPPSSHDRQDDTSTTSSSVPSLWVMRPPREESLEHLDAFLREHVEYTGAAGDGVPVGELHLAFLQLCRARGVRPPPDVRLSSRLLDRREGVVISRLNFESVKWAYQGLRWTRTALDALQPSTRPRPTPCSSCEARQRAAPAVAGVLEEARSGMEARVEAGASASGGWREDTQGGTLSLMWDDENPKHRQTLQAVPPPPLQPAIMPPSASLDRILPQSTADLTHLFETYNQGDYYTYNSADPFF